MRLRRKLGQAMAFVFRPLPSHPRDLVADGDRQTRLFSTMGRSLPVLSAIALGIFVAKLLYVLDGDLSYVLAVLERISLTQAALFASLSLAYAGTTYGVLWAVGVITSPNFSPRTRRACRVGLPLALIFLVRIASPFQLLSVGVVYLVTNVCWKLLARRQDSGTVETPKRPTLQQWASANLANEDIELRNLANAASKLAVGQHDQDLARKINERAKLVAQRSGVDRALGVISASGFAVLNLVLIAGLPLSGTYVIDLAGKPVVGYMVIGSQDALLIESKSGNVHFMSVAETESRRLCPDAYSKSWLMRPLSAAINTQKPRGCP